MVMPDRAKADLLSRTPKVITEELQWRGQDNYRRRLEARVLAPELNEALKLVGFVGRTNYGFALLFKNHPIRKLNKHHKHRNSNGKLVFGMHKHTWDEVNRDKDSYIPNDIDPNGDIDDIFLAFLEEENIELREPYQRVLRAL